MGYFKELQIRIDEQGWIPSDQFVCEKCIADPTLAAYISESLQLERDCSFCNRSGAAKLDVLLDDFINGIRNDYQKADDEGLARDGAEYQWPHWDTWDLLDRGYSDDIGNQALFEAVRACLPMEMWAVLDGWRLPKDQWLKDAWDVFVQKVHRSPRMDDWLAIESEASDPDDLSPREILEHVADSLQPLGLIRSTGPHFVTMRARQKEAGWETWKAGELGTAPGRYAKANRFSGAGTEMFYGAEDEDTCAMEIRLDSAIGGVLGRFSVDAGLQFLDLTSLPPVPSVYDRELGPWRRDIMFLHTFADECSKPLKDAAVSPEVGYTPTQVVAEFFFGSDHRAVNVDAIRFLSSLTGQPCWVINLPHTACLNDRANIEGKLSLRLVATKTI